MKPERPWIHDYSHTVVMKLHLCDRDADGKVAKVYLTFEQALQMIEKLDNITLGIPKIIYLVGWSNELEPSWHGVNEQLKRPQDKNAQQSLKWLMTEAKRYHTTVSLHVNMIDASELSPLWKSYEENNIILKDKNGEPIKGETFDGLQSYQNSYAQEWRLGFAQKRIDQLLQMLPELKQAGTIHIDAFHSVQPMRPALQPGRLDDDQFSSPYLGLRIQDEIEAQRKIIRYWRMKGLDVTSEDAVNHLKPDPFIGLIPMVWWYDTEAFRMFDWPHKPADFVGLPPRLYVGTPMHAETEVMQDPEHLNGLTQQFCENVVPWYYVNDLAPKEAGFVWTPNEHGVFVPALWLPATIVACVKKDSDPNYQTIQATRSWRLPQSWRRPSTVKLMRITPDGLEQQAVLPVENNTVRLTLKAGVVYAIQK